MAGIGNAEIFGKVCRQVLELLPWVPEVCLARFPVSVNVSIVTRAKNLWRRAPFL